MLYNTKEKTSKKEVWRVFATTIGVQTEIMVVQEKTQKY